MNNVRIIENLEGELINLQNKKNDEIKMVNTKYIEIENKIRTTLETLKELNTACLKCHGTGKLRDVHESGAYEEYYCPECKGTGKYNAR